MYSSPRCKLVILAALDDEAEGLQSLPELWSEFKASLSNLSRLYLKIEKV